jgi:hypothetical protein
MAPSFSAIRTILFLSAFWSLATAEAASPLGKRDSLLLPRQRTCRNPSWIPVCPGQFSSKFHSTTFRLTHTGAFPCIPPGAVCCSDDITYVIPPEVCPDGTSPVATAITSDTLSATTATITTPPTVPTTLPPVTEYTWYTWTITYYYYYYYYTYFSLSYDLTSTQTTYYTTVSFTATDDVEASSLLAELSATLSEEIPTQTATLTVGETPVETSTSSVHTSVSASATIPYPTGNFTVPTSASPSQYTGAAASVRAGTASYFGNLVVLVAGMGVMVPGALMVWL